MRCWTGPRLGSPVALTFTREARDLRNTSGIAEINADSRDHQGRLCCRRASFDASAECYWRKAEHE
jgi:hypothetical protein